MAADKRTIKERIDDHLVGFAASVAVATALVVFGVTSYFHSQQIDALKASHEEKLVSINRKLAGGDYLDVRKLIVPRSERNHISKGNTFFGAELFYAAMPPEWSYQKTSDIDVWNTIYGKVGEKPDNPLTGIVPIYVWRRGPFI